MLYSSPAYHFADRVGTEKAMQMLMDAGFPALDMSFFDDYSETLGADGKALAKRLRADADARGVVYNQAHAPFQGTYDFFMENQLPNFPRVFEFCSILGVKNIVVHPIKNCRYYGNEEKLFHMNVEYYRSLAPLAKDNGVKIAIENIFTRHPVVQRNICPSVGADPHEHARLFDTLADPEAFTLCLDVGHAALCGKEPEDVIRVLGRERLGALHVHDVDYIDDLHTLPGVGKLHWDAICRSLGEIDYAGELTLEAVNFVRRYPVEFLPTVLRFMNDTAKMYADKVDFYRKRA